MPRNFVAAAFVVGVALACAPAGAFAQPSYGSSQRDIAPPGQPGGYGQSGRGQGGYGQNGYRQAGYGQTGQGQGGYGQNGYGQAAYGRNGYDQGPNGQQGYDTYGPQPCAEDDDLESLQCHHRTHSRGWYYRSEREAYLRGDHSRGYQDDGTGRRSYDRGGYGVGHFDYTRDYDPLRGY